jgi:hypothetical protein
VQVDDWGTRVFNHWSNSGSTSNQTFFMSPGDGAAALFIAVFNCVGVTSTVTLSLGVSTVNSAGTTISGILCHALGERPADSELLLTLRVTVNNGVTYQVAVPNFGNEVFSHWQDGTASRFYTIAIPNVILSIGAELTATYSP